MRLADFIEANLESILREWEAFARSIWPRPLKNQGSDLALLRDHAADILIATCHDIRQSQTEFERRAKAEGISLDSVESRLVDRASAEHARHRMASEFELWALVAEYRALRASVLRLWRESTPEAHAEALDDLTRFNESIDQSLTEAIRCFAEIVERDRQALLDSEQQARSEAEQSNRAKDIFLATLSHEMRTPLNAIVGWVEVLRTKEHTDPEMIEGLDVIERNTRAQVGLIEDILDVSRIISGRLRLDIGDCDLTRSIHAAIEGVRPAARARDISLRVELDPAAGTMRADESRIQQIVWNLLSNAIKFTPEGGTVRVVLHREPAGYRVSVSDNGNGIEPDLLPHVFERFRQGERNTRRQSNGLGLGLSIVKHLAEMHGGTVEAHSLGKGKGATFSVYLPDTPHAVHYEAAQEMNANRKRASEEVVLPDEVPPEELEGIRVMIVEDEPHARTVLERLLARSGAKVTSAGGVAEALAGLSIAQDRGQTPHMLVSDIGMPDLDGYELVREVRRRGYKAEELPAVALTAYVSPQDADEALRAGFQAHLKKPVDIRQLTAVIARLAHPVADRSNGS